MPERENINCTGFRDWPCAFCLARCFLQPLDVYESAFITKYKLRIDLQPFCP